MQEFVNLGIGGDDQGRHIWGVSMPRRSSLGNGPNGQVASGCKPKDQVAMAVSSDASSGWTDAAGGSGENGRDAVEGQQARGEVAVVSEQSEAEANVTEVCDDASSEGHGELEIFSCEGVTDSGGEDVDQEADMEVKRRQQSLQRKLAQFTSLSLMARLAATQGISQAGGVRRQELQRGQEPNPQVECRGMSRKISILNQLRDSTFTMKRHCASSNLKGNRLYGCTNCHQRLR